MSYYLHFSNSDTTRPKDIQGTNWAQLKQAFEKLVEDEQSEFVALWHSQADTESLSGSVNALSLGAGARRRVFIYESGDPANWWSQLSPSVRGALLEDPRRPWDQDLQEALSGVTGSQAFRIASQDEGGHEVPTLGSSGVAFVEYFQNLSSDRQSEVLRRAS